MTVILADNNLSGQAGELWRLLSQGGWLKLWPIEFVSFAEIGLSVHASDLRIWMEAQQRGMVLLTFDRRMTGRDSLEETIRCFNTAESLPVITIGNQDRFEHSSEYREQCAVRLFEVVFEIERYLGAARLFIP